MTTDLTTRNQAEANVPTRQPINMSLSAKGLVPTTYNELMQMAMLLHQSGLAPNSLDTVQKVAVAAAMCLELGRPIMSGIQDMAVINGKVSMFGDAILGLIRASGELELFDQWEDGKPLQDDWVIYTKVKRRGGKEKTSSFSWMEAKRAGYDNPKKRDGSADYSSPWRRYTRRMMMFKSRNFLLRDEFGDILKGMKAQEDIEDLVDLEPGSEGLFSQPEPAIEKARKAAESTEVSPDPAARLTAMFPAEEPARAAPAPKEEPCRKTYVPVPAEDITDGLKGGEPEPELEPAAGEEGFTPPDTHTYFVLGSSSGKVEKMVLTEEEIIELLVKMRAPGVTAFWENNLIEKLPADVRKLAEDKYNRLVKEKEQAAAAEQQPKQAPPPLKAAISCPKKDGKAIFTSYCEKDCANRDNCPSYQEHLAGMGLKKNQPIEAPARESEPSEDDTLWYRIKTYSETLSPKGFMNVLQLHGFKGQIPGDIMPWIKTLAEPVRKRLLDDLDYALSFSGQNK